MRLRQNPLALQSSMRAICIFCRRVDAALRLPTKLAESCPIKPWRCGDQCCVIQVFCRQIGCCATPSNSSCRINRHPVQNRICRLYCLCVPQSVKQAADLEHEPTTCTLMCFGSSDSPFTFYFGFVLVLFLFSSFPFFLFGFWLLGFLI